MTDKLIEEIDALLDEVKGNSFLRGSKALGDALTLLHQCRDRLRWVPVSERRPEREGKYFVLMTSLSDYIEPSLDEWVCNYTRGLGFEMVNHRAVYWLDGVPDIPQPPQQSEQEQSDD